MSINEKKNESILYFMSKQVHSLDLNIFWGKAKSEVNMNCCTYGAATCSNSYNVHISIFWIEAYAKSSTIKEHLSAKCLSYVII